ncbi:DNA internalization-related competence protein ComEC/Rec2, partial [Candidatus Margulisiibacteriota bacterium]
LYLKGVKGVFFAQGARFLEKRWLNPFRRIAYFLKAKVLAINNKTLPYPYSDLYTGLVFGDHGTDLPEEMADRFQKTGLTHLLVVSGSQVALLTGILLAIFSALNLPFKRSFILITIINIIFYFVTGGGASIFRAILMCEIALSVKLMRKNVDFYHIFAFTALVMLLINPFYLFDVGAQLSFIATFALVYGVPKIAEILPEKLPEKIKTALGISLSPFIFSLPILWFYFNTISPVSIISNLLVINAIELLVTVGFFSTVIGFFILPITQIINDFSLLVMVVLNKVVYFLSSLPFATIKIRAPHIIVTVFLYAIILFLIHNINKKNKKYIQIGLLSLALVFAFSIFPSFLPKRHLKVTFLDVGQGDAILIETPKRKNILIDAGNVIYDFSTGKELYNLGKAIVEPALAAKGINKLDIIVTTHFHADHIGGIPYIINNNICNLVFDNGRKDHRYWSYKNVLKEKEINPIKGAQGYKINLEKGLSLTFYYPFKDAEYNKNENNNSVVCKLSFGKIDFMFTGDLEAEIEAELAELYGEELEAEVFKLGHHGSKTSNSAYFLDYVSPLFGVICVGEKNKFRHPSRSTLTRLNARNIEILRTDEDGAIEFLTDGKRLYYNKYN